MQYVTSTITHTAGDLNMRRGKIRIQQQLVKPGEGSQSRWCHCPCGIDNPGGAEGSSSLPMREVGPEGKKTDAPSCDHLLLNALW